MSDPSTPPVSDERVDHLLHPLAVQISTLLTRDGRLAAREIIIDDEQNILQYRSTGAEVQRVFLAEDHDCSPAEIQALAGQAPVSILARRTSKKLFGNERLSRVFAIAPLPPLRALAQLPAIAGDVLVLDNLQISGNIGAIIRTAFALNAGAIVILDMDPIDLHDRRTIRASRGYIFRMPIVACATSELLAFAKSAAIHLVATAAGGTTPVAAIAADPRQFWLILGAEKQGCRPVLQQSAAAAVSIPMHPEAESLNVSVAASILMYVRNSKPAVST
jgi:23S rRNA (adenosine1067-2'-O)-methyltransferase